MVRTIRTILGYPLVIIGVIFLGAGYFISGNKELFNNPPQPHD